MNSSSSRSAPRRYGTSCLPCRKHKVRCDGRKPVCHGCSRRGRECVYGSTAETATELRSIQSQLHSLQQKVVSLNRKAAQDCHIALAELSSLGSSLEAELAIRNPDVDDQMTPPSESSPSIQGFGDPSDQARAERTVDAYGKLHFYGATSRFHDSPYETQRHNAEPASQTDIDFHTKWLRSNARFQQSWEQKVIQSLPSLTGVPQSTAQILLEIYWTWQAPLHNCVYRRCFFRDMAIGGPYFSDFLLTVIFAHACRHTKSDDERFAGFRKGELFMEQAKSLLIAELETPRIPTIQGLLILGGRQCAIGKNSEGWLYTSMAISMVKDMGLHLPVSHLELLQQLEPDDLEARKRLYCSAYSWDKSISLTLGRPPSLIEMPYPEHSFLDTFDDDETWSPVYLQIEYPPTPGCITSTFSHFCELARIGNDIYQNVYAPRRYDRLSHQMFLELEKRIRAFYDNLDAEIKIDHASSLLYCPPPHILCLNVLYYTMLILVYRPFCQANKQGAQDSQNSTVPSSSIWTHAEAVCASSAAQVNTMFQAYGRTYNYQKQTYLLSYCVYTAATIELLQVQKGDGDATERLETTLQMLLAEAEQTPGIRRSVDIIQSQLQEFRQVPDQIIQTFSSGENHVAVDQGAALLHPHSANPNMDISGLDMSNSVLGTDMFDNQEIDTWLDWNSFDASGGFVQ